MQSSYQPGDQVLVFDVPDNRARAEAGDESRPARPAVVEEDVTPHGTRWDPFGDPARRGGAYVDDGPQGDAVYLVRFADGSTASASVHQLALSSEVAAAIHRRAAASEAAAQEHAAEVARHSAEAERLHQAAKAVHQG